ncbi:hypothetical protein R1flu_002506 [Riccia fluitans]|uniref:Uncharacterized protein n=1 Tax=Riccia fluitans TaxID=41844 RepID=A0ABD1Y6E4_9MARC
MELVGSRAFIEFIVRSSAEVRIHIHRIKRSTAPDQRQGLVRGWTERDQPSLRKWELENGDEGSHQKRNSGLWRVVPYAAARASPVRSFQLNDSRVFSNLDMLGDRLLPLLLTEEPLEHVRSQHAALQR